MNTPRAMALAAVLVSCTYSPIASAQPTGNWARVPFVIGPSARGESAMAYDSVRNRVVLFGGSRNCNSAHLGDTWEWDGTQWMLMATTGPSPRRKPAMWFDPTIGKTMLFGGTNGGGITNLFNDMWAWDGVSWQQVSVPNPKPSPRYDMPAIFDAARSSAMLFDGFTGDLHTSQTWAWNGATWSLLSPTPAPAGRGSAALAYSNTGGFGLLFGGSLYLAPDDNVTWRWDAAGWTALVGGGPSPRWGMTFSHDSVSNSFVLHGGYDTETGRGLGDTWRWDTGVWSRVAASGPRPRFSAASVEGPNGRVLLFGGYDGCRRGGQCQWADLGDFWEWYPERAACPANLDDGSMTGSPDTGVDVSDLLYFLEAFGEGNASADIDNGSSAGTPDCAVDIADLLFFLLHFEQGC